MSIPEKPLFLASVSQISSSNSLKFNFILNNKKMEGFVINEKGHFFAYLNRCRHLGVTLDWDTHHFYTPGKDALICKTHGASYHPSTGKCAGGPCAGKSLFSLPLFIHSDQIFLDLEKAKALCAE